MSIAILRIIPVVWCVCIGLSGCASEVPENVQRTVRFWHFWSEPSQKRELENLLHQFERQNPGLKVELTDLSWNDGKSKLALAFNSGAQPDIIQLGFEWTPEFASQGVLAPLPDSLLRSHGGALATAVNCLRYRDRQYALPWSINARAMLVNTAALRAEGFSAAEPPRTWEDLERIVRSFHKPDSGRYGFGVNATEPHNVLKKALPILWSGGSGVFASAPLAATFDSAAVTGLDLYRRLATYGVQERSRILDEMFLRGAVGVWITGAWILDMVDDASADFVVLPAFPVHINGARGSSILAGDCLAVSAGSANKNDAFALLSFLCRYPQAKRFCLAVSDAGIPADTAAFSDAQFSSTPHSAGFTAQVSVSRPLPYSPVFLAAEAIIEEAVMRVVYDKTSPGPALRAAQTAIEKLERP